jgi:hypothetical protein
MEGRPAQSRRETIACAHPLSANRHVALEQQCRRRYSGQMDSSWQGGTLRARVRRGSLTSCEVACMKIAEIARRSLWRIIWLASARAMRVWLSEPVVR